MIRHGRHVPNQCPKQHFPRVLLPIFNITGEDKHIIFVMGVKFLASALNRGSHRRKYLKCLVIPALARNMAPMTNHHASTLCFFLMNLNLFVNSTLCLEHRRLARLLLGFHVSLYSHLPPLLTLE